MRSSKNSLSRIGHLTPVLAGVAFAAVGATAVAAPKTYQIDSSHTYPSFEVDHTGGTSVWRGKFNSTSGTVTMDKEAGTGTVNVTIDAKSVDFGHDGLNKHVTGEERPDPAMLDVAKFPTATYEGRLTAFANGAPTKVEGNLTLHGVTKPVNLEIRSFKCAPARQGGGETCGADAYAEFNRADFGVSFGQSFGFDMKVVLRIQIEARSAT
jgi:polyisoprenoid-binding protein YceI